MNEIETVLRGIADKGSLTHYEARALEAAIRAVRALQFVKLERTFRELQLNHAQLLTYAREADDRLHAYEVALALADKNALPA